MMRNLGREKQDDADGSGGGHKIITIRDTDTKLNQPSTFKSTVK